MDAILEDHIFILEDLVAPNEENSTKTNEEISLWVKEKDIIKPSTNIIILNKLEPGVYTADYSRDFGYFCRKLESSSDELFIFSDSITEDLLAEINLFWKKKDKFIEQKLIHKRGILLEGYPGTGKSSIITQLSDEVIKQGGVVFKVSNFRNLNDYVGFMRVGFRKIQPETPIITILEDIDQYEEVDTELLDFLDGKTHINHHVVIATSNNTEEISDTFLRPSRLDLKIEVPLPSAKTREEYFKFKGVPEEVVKDLVIKSDKCSLADLKEIYICIYLLDYSIDDALMKVTTPREKKNYLYKPQKTGLIGL